MTIYSVVLINAFLVTCCVYASFWHKRAVGTAQKTLPMGSPVELARIESSFSNWSVELGDTKWYTYDKLTARALENAYQGGTFTKRYIYVPTLVPWPPSGSDLKKQNNRRPTSDNAQMVLRLSN